MNNNEAFQKIVFALMLVLGANITLAQSSVDEAFAEFWAANSIEETDASVQSLLQSGVTFEDAYQRLQQGRDYSAGEAGISLHSYVADDGTEFFYHVNVPADYDPSLEYQVRFELHGGVGGRRNGKPGNRDRGRSRIEGVEQIYIMPYAWRDAPWWSDVQVENLRVILDQVKRNYNVNENRVALAGISDGGTGLQYIAMRETTRFANFEALISYIMVLANPPIDDGRSFLNNLLNKSILLINGVKDPLYPAERARPIIEYFQANGADIDFYAMENGEHNTRWWRDMRDTFEEFVTVHPRLPHPVYLTWKATEGLNNRAHWVVVDEIDVDQRAPVVFPELGIDSVRSLFNMTDEAGRVDVQREGNSITAMTDGIASFTLLLSPDVFDLSQEIQVVANNEVVFSGMVEASTETLLNWAARDNDRKMLYAAELHIEL
jgi:predicted esterase